MAESTLNQVTKEVEDMHVFFTEWYQGTCPNDDENFQKRFADRLTENHKYVMPGGALFTKDKLVQVVRPVFGSNPNFKIQIRDVQVGWEDDNAVLAMYTEFQKGAKNSRPENVRRTSVLFLKSKETVSSSPPLLWQLIHETWVPEEELAKATFDF